jgi:UDP-N-acetylglucosamine diphosphorylase / glucose-1-phosphate thymidylyltransferase / UDP-N-acetylgalactosamine diphosphorylase / glucosamine-1-phosphate N-acetyltransferase / galactosamine-1-phosphate N-acetyltransferase
MYAVADLFDLTQTEHADLFDGCQYPWEVLRKLAEYCRSRPDRGQHHKALGTVHIGEHVQIGEGTILEPGVTILGPAIIGRNCVLRHNAYLRENCVIGDNCTVGNACEVKNSLFFNKVSVPHFNYVGDCVLGYHAHLGAGAALSNLKLDGATVWVEGEDGVPIDTGLRKFGSLLGDNTDIGCNAVLNPGSVIGRNSMVYPNLSWRGFLPANMIAKHKARPEVVVRRPRGVV